MVSEKPPRHSKSKTEPVTIDLDPKDVKRSTEETAENAPVNVAPETSPMPSDESKTTDKAEPKPEVPLGSDGKKPETVGAAQWSKGPDVKFTSTSSNTTSSGPTPNTGTPKSNAESASTASSAKAGPSGPTKPSSMSTSSASSSESKKPSHQGASSSGAMAAGIFGGLIALLAAGSLQYAGYIPGLKPSTDNGELLSLQSEIDALKQSVATVPTAQFDSTALEQRMSALEANKSAPQAIGVAGIDGLSGKLSSVDSQLEQLKAQLAEAASTNKALTERLTAAEEKINEPRDDIEIARAIAAAALKAAIDRGGPFLTELDTLLQVTPDDEQLKGLQPFASTGVPSRSEILTSFPAEATNILAQINQPDPNLGIMDRLTQSAMSLVSVRPVGNVAGDTPEAIIARIEDKLRNGDLKGAALEWDALPTEAKSSGFGFKKALDARVQVEELVGSAVTRALTKNAEQG
jgi:hypothetical protein